MSRLTKYINTMVICSHEGTEDCNEENYCLWCHWNGKALHKLAQYEDLEEQCFQMVNIEKVVAQLEERKITPARYLIFHRLKGESIADNPYYATGFNRAIDIAIQIMEEGAK